MAGFASVLECGSSMPLFKTACCGNGFALRRRLNVEAGRDGCPGAFAPGQGGVPLRSRDGCTHSI